MNMRINMKQWMIAGLAGLLALPVAAQEDALKALPGYVDFGQLTDIYGEPKVMINLGGTILKFVSAATEDDPETAALMSGLKGVRVNVFDTGGNATPAVDQLNTVKARLQKDAWEPIVQVNEEGEQVQIFIKLVDDQMQGMTVMAVNEEEAVFVNIIGELDPEQLSKVMGKFDIDIDEHLEVN